MCQHYNSSALCLHSKIDNHDQGNRNQHPKGSPPIKFCSCHENGPESKGCYDLVSDI